MKLLRLSLAALLLIASAAHAQVALTPIVSGLSSPVFATSARDGTGRLYIVEQAGVVKSFAAGSTSPTTLLDIRGRVLSGGERGLLGLAFHPQFASNGRFFVYYTRQSDGAITIEERPSGRVLLTIAHPLTNHNGGMLAFGPDGGLFAGVGDGGGANDPNNNAQNPNSRLGKILRLNVDTGSVEVYALGLRNPWRFSFDRVTGALICGDVGQDAREEIDVITRGGNYGWRIREGFLCSGNDPGLCGSSGFTNPIADYGHSGGRCSITGGYAYRGTRGTFQAGDYLFADFCSGEIFRLRGGAMSVLLSTSQNITSFGEDEAGEILVVSQGGTVSRLTSPTAAPPPVTVPPPTTPGCTFAVSPASASYAAVGGSGSVSVTTGAACHWSAVSGVSWVHLAATSGTGSGSVGYTVDANSSTSSRTGALTVAGKSVSITQGGAPPSTPPLPVTGPGSGVSGGRYRPPSGGRRP